ncbi:MAG: helix-hairpin-helix domain-containing protein [Campylobacterales bacterium]|nr:helix-hairpin-helix domain-containing protein [Campylobacterales bacterium]
MSSLITIIAQKTSIAPQYVGNILSLLQEGATIPFIARYRKERSGNATDEQLRLLLEVYMYTQKLLERQAEIKRLLSERGLLEPTLEAQIDAAQSLQLLEDLYRPYRQKQSSRAANAIAAGLEPLSDCIASGVQRMNALREEARRYCCDAYADVDAVLLGAQDILAERYSDDPAERAYWRAQMLEHASFEIKGTKHLVSGGLYAKLAGTSERIASIPAHRYLAIMRGVAHKELSVKIPLEPERIERRIRHYTTTAATPLFFEACMDGFKRLLLPSLEREVHTLIKERSDERSIATFGRNLSQLLLAAPVTGRAILGVDPAYRSGCKLAVTDSEGEYLAHAVIYPTPPQSDYAASAQTVKALHVKYGFNAVAIGNGTGSRETQEFFARLVREEALELAFTVVSEAGASVYSASKIAQEEYPQLDVTIRGALSIAQRLRDPMAALVKIDPKSLGVGQYQHDVDQKRLEQKLHDVTEALVNSVGVDPNSASRALLSYVAGVGPKLSERMVAHRQSEGGFTCKHDLLRVKGLGKKAFEQCAGFFRIRNGKSVLDNTGVHPEHYEIAQALLRDGVDLHHVGVSEAQRYGVGEATLRDIALELQKPGRDPREELPPILFRQDVTDIASLRPGDKVAGVVRNIADFGAFVDIGLKNDGLIHISQMSERRIAHPLEVLSVNQQLLEITVLEVDAERGKVSLSLRA